jgi:hypothetical protein
MSSERGVAKYSSAAFRFASRLLPPHRKEWGEAMLNEIPYITSRKAASRWLFGCLMAALRERVIFELGRTFMTRRLVKVMMGLVAILVIGAIGTYIDAKPYQRERIWITVHDFIHPGSPERPARN